MAKENPAATPPTVESLTAELTAARTLIAEKDQQLTAQLAEKDQQLVALEAARKQLVEKDGLIAALHADKAQLMGVIDEQGQTIGDLDAQVASLQGKPFTNPRFKLGRETYEVGVGTFTYKKQTYTAEQLLSDKALQQKLVDAKMGFITLIED